MSEWASRTEDADGPGDAVSTVDTGTDDDIVTPLSVAGILWNADVVDSSPTYTAEPAPTHQGSGIELPTPATAPDTYSPAPTTYEVTPTPAPTATPTPAVDYSTPATYDSTPVSAPDTSSFS